MCIRDSVDGANNNTVGDETPIVVVGGEDTPGNDFVDEQLGSIAGTVLEDIDNDDAGEDPIAGVTITLLDDTGATVATAVTDSNGAYLFEDVVPGDYIVSESQPSGFADVLDEDSTVPGDDAVNADPLDDVIPVSIVSGELDDGNDFIEEQLGSLSGTVLEDTDNDGVGEDPIAGVTITLLDEDGATVATAVTDSNGDYSFADLEPGNYSVVESDPTDFVSVGDVDGANNNTVGDETPIAVVGGEDASGNDFVDEQLGSLSLIHISEPTRPY